MKQKLLVQFVLYTMNRYSKWVSDARLFIFYTYAVRRGVGGSETKPTLSVTPPRPPGQDYKMYAFKIQYIFFWEEGDFYLFWSTVPMKKQYSFAR